MTNNRWLLTGVGAVVAATAFFSPFVADTPHAQVTRTGALQSAGGGPGPGAAPDAKDPANAIADLSPRPPVVPQTPEDLLVHPERSSNLSELVKNRNPHRARSPGPGTP